MSENSDGAPAGPISEDARRSILLKAGLLTSDPSSYPGLSLRMNPEFGLDTSFKPVGYDTRHSTEKMVHCSICPQQQEHFDGAIVRLMDGKIGLVGNTCGKRHFFGDDGWSAITNRMRQDAEQALFLARFGPAKEMLATVDKLLGRWEGALSRVAGVQNRFTKEMPSLAKAVRQQVRGGVLYVDQSIQVPFRQPNGDVKMLAQIQQVPVCRLEADWFFLEGSLSTSVLRARLQLRQAGGFLSADANAMNIAAVKRMMRECRNLLDLVGGKQRQLTSLTSENTILKLADWGNVTLKSRDQYNSSGQKLLRVHGDDIKATIDFAAIPNDLEQHWKSVVENWPSL